MVGRPVRRGMAVSVIAVSAMLSGFASPSVAALATSSPQASSASGLAYDPVSPPTRICDTRPSSVSGLTDSCTGQTLSPGGVLTVPLPASLPSDTGAVVVNVTAIDSTAPGFLTVYPAAAAPPSPLTANVDFTTGQIIGNLVTVGVESSSSSLAIDIFDGPAAGGGSINVTVDLQGYYASPAVSGGDVFDAVTPTRIADTRCSTFPEPSYCSGENLPYQNSQLSAVGPGATDTLTVAGVGNVPSNASAVVLNVAVTKTTAPSFLFTYPTGSPPSTPVANQDWVAGETLASKVIVGVGSGGQVTVANHAGSVDIVVDVDGYFVPAGSTGALFTPLSSPVRLLDTRPTGVAGGQSAPLSIDGSNGVPSNATAAVLNVTDVTPASGNYLTVYPGGTSVPTASDVNFVPGDVYGVVGNASYASIGSNGGVDVFNGPTNAGATNIVADLFGYFAPPPVSTSPVSTATSENTGSSTNPDLVAGDQLVVTFSEPVIVSSQFDLYLTDGTNTAYVGAADTNATAAISNTGETVTITLTGAPSMILGTSISLTDLEVLTATGISNASGPWNVVGSGFTSGTPIPASVAPSGISSVTRVFGGTNTALPRVVSTADATPPNTVTATCGSTRLSSFGYVNVYNAAGTNLGSASCASSGPTTVTTSSSFSSGNTILITEALGSNPDFIGYEGQTAAVTAT